MSAPDTALCAGSVGVYVATSFLSRLIGKLWMSNGRSHQQFLFAGTGGVTVRSIEQETSTEIEVQRRKTRMKSGQHQTRIRITGDQACRDAAFEAIRRIWAEWRVSF